MNVWSSSFDHTQTSQTPPCAQARMVRTAKEHEVIMARNMMSNHTDMQDKYCGHSNDINPIQSQYKGNHRRGATALRPRHLFCGGGPRQHGGLGSGTPPSFGSDNLIISRLKACQTCFSMERKERNFAFKHYEVLNKMSCVAGLEDLRTDKPQSIENLLKKMARELVLESGPNI